MENWGPSCNLTHLAHEGVLKRRTKWWSTQKSERWELSDPSIREGFLVEVAESDTHCHITGVIPGNGSHSEIVHCRTPGVMSHSHGTCPWTYLPVFFLPPNNVCTLNALCNIWQANLELRLETSLSLEKTQKMSMLGPLMIVGLQPQLDPNHI